MRIGISFGMIAALLVACYIGTRFPTMFSRVPLIGR